MTTMGEVFPDLFEPQTVLPCLTNPGRVHMAVATNGLLPGGINNRPPMYVRTRCGLPDLGPCEPCKRDSGFPDCKRCFPAGDPS